MSFEKSQSETGSRVFEQQAPFLRELWGRGADLMRGQLGSISGAAEDLVGQFLPGASTGVDTLTGLARGEGAGQEYLTESLGPNPHLDAVIDALGGDIRRNLGREVGSGIASEAAGTGGAYGSSRHGIREGMAHEAATREFTDAASRLRYGDYTASADRAASLTDSQLRAAGVLPSAASAGYNLGISPFNAAWLPIQQYAAALGRPTVLTEGESSGFGIAI